MIWKPSEELQAKIRADIDSHFEDRKQILVRDLELEHREAIREFERWTSGKTTNVPLPQESSTAPSQGKVTANGSSKSLTIRQMVLRVMPEFQDEDSFMTSDIRDEILERWPETVNKQLLTHISQLLKKMYEDGKLDRFGKGPRIQDPWHYRYRTQQNNEDTPLKSGP